MSVRSAEMTKYAANCMLATKISFMNEMANISQRIGADIEEVRNGIGYGGSCFPKDVKALIKTASETGYQPKNLESVEFVNNRQKKKLYELVCQYYGINANQKKSLKGKTFALWGLSFKPKTDDMREAPSRVIMASLWRSGAKVQAYDPESMAEVKRIYGCRSDLEFGDSKESVLENADALIICTEWQNFKAPNFLLIKECLADSVIFDDGDLFNDIDFNALKIAYWSIGRESKGLY